MEHRVLVLGAAGRMGQMVVNAVHGAPDMVYAGGVGRGDDVRAVIAATQPSVLVDFTTPEAVIDHMHAGIEAGISSVVGTSGLIADDLYAVDKKAKTAGVGVVYGANFALGAVLLMRFAREAARYFPQAEVIELHHDQKYDAPSGTAIRTAEAIASVREAPPADDRTIETLKGARGCTREGVPIHSVRLPGFVAHQEVLLGSPGQTLRIRHDLIDRESFMPGVLLAVRRVGDLVGVHDVEDLLFPSRPSSHPLG